MRTPAGLAAGGGVDNSRPITNVELAESLCSVSTPLYEARRVHLTSYGCLVPHVFMGDVLKRIGECLAVRTVHAKTINRPEVHGILAALERGMLDGE